MLELAERLIHSGHLEAASVLLSADGNGKTSVRLNARDRDAILAVLEEQPGFESLRGVLLAQRQGEEML
jgi:hypothetical protein